VDITIQSEDLDHETDSQINEFSKNYLVVEESKHLTEFRNEVSQYSVLENKIIRLFEKESTGKAHKLFYKEGFLLFNETIKNLHSLSQIQTDIAQKLMSKSKDDMSNVTLLYTLQIILVFIIGAMVQALIFTSKSLIPKRNQKFDLIKLITI